VKGRVQVCAANRLVKEPELAGRLAELGYAVDTEECLDQCTRCHQCAFALVSGRLRFAANNADLLRKLQERIPGFRWGS
jgi:uncharacterized protein YuzB (UPF0349 family)